VTEAEQPSGSAPTQSVRPRARPQRVVETQPEQPADPTEPVDQADAPNPTADAVAAALAEALGDSLGESLGEPEPQDASGPTLSAGETDALVLAVQNCWVVDVGSEAANVTVVVGMDMDPSGQVVFGSMRLVSSTGGEGAAVETAFQAARRAVLRCQKEGYDLPPEKYETWKQIEMTFNPKDMRIR
jgi:hypothetical protein